MKLVTISTIALLASSATAATCPFSLLKRAGLLQRDDEAAFDAVRANPRQVDAILKSHYQKRSGTPHTEKLHGPRSADGLLDLPLGGGLCKHQS